MNITSFGKKSLAAFFLCSLAFAAAAQMPQQQQQPPAQSVTPVTPTAPPAAAPEPMVEPTPAAPQSAAVMPAPKPQLSPCARAIKSSEKALEKSSASTDNIAQAWQHIQAAKQEKGAACVAEAKAAQEML